MRIRRDPLLSILLTIMVGLVTQIACLGVHVKDIPGTLFWTNTMLSMLLCKRYMDRPFDVHAACEREIAVTCGASTCQLKPEKRRCKKYVALKYRLSVIRELMLRSCSASTWRRGTLVTESTSIGADRHVRACVEEFAF